jgi:hypothetical protein
MGYSEVNGGPVKRLLLSNAQKEPNKGYSMGRPWRQELRGTCLGKEVLLLFLACSDPSTHTLGPPP